MFYKFTTFGMPAMLSRRGGEYRSIANKIAILHTLAVFFSVSFASVLLYKNLLDHLNQANSKQIREEIASVKTMLMSPTGSERLGFEIAAESRESEAHKVFIRVIDPNGKTVRESFGLHAIIPAHLFHRSDAGPGAQKFRTPSGNLFLLESCLLTENSSIGIGQIQIAMDISDDEIFARKVMVALVVFSLFGLLFAVFSAFYIIRMCLMPLNEISDKIKDITETNLDMRLDVSLLPEEMKSLGESFNIMLSRMENSFKKLTQYSENLAHELRTPLNNLILEAGIALSRQRTAEEYQKVINSSMEEYDRLSLLIDRLLFLVRADNNQHRLEMKKINVLEVLENIVEFYSEAVSDKAITVTIVGTASLMADLVLFNRAVSNLFFNALKYTEQGGSIVLVIEQNNNSIEISVQDTGCGIDPLLLPKIFDRYFWVESTRQKDHKGTGLGLDIVKAIMKLHGGNVEIQSELGRGTTVKLQFPLVA
ncbi:MAG TPA: heavy metal sensor histidine kinase [Desulfuromonadales bacterium]|nr:heavy metal sensor histidine kinase [Desulfuromonadales bacterium]